jgi:hypothetical protein
MIDWCLDPPDILDTAGLTNHLTAAGLANEVRDALAEPGPPLGALPGASLGEAEQAWWHFFNYFGAAEVRSQIEAAQDRFDKAPTYENLNLVVALREAELRLIAGETGGENSA